MVANRPLSEILRQDYPHIVGDEELPAHEIVRKLAEKGIAASKTTVKDVRISLRNAVPAVKAVVASDMPERLLALLKRAAGARVSISHLADGLDVAPKHVKEALVELENGRYLTEIEDDAVRLSAKPDSCRRSTINLEPYKKTDGSWFRIGVCSDNHLCSKYERMDVLNALYDIYHEEGIMDVFNAGNWIDGEARFNTSDLHTHGMGNQLQYFVDNYPARDGVTTHYIAGDDHEGWYVQRNSIEIGMIAEDFAHRAGRNDLKYLGYMEHDVILPAPEGETAIRVQHPGGGTSYALSYKSQKLVDSLSGGEKPQILILGHWHKAEQLFYRNVNVIQAGCTMDQSPFMRKQNLAAHVGGWIVEFNQAPDGSINRFRAEFMPFFDREYYSKKWFYRT